MEIRPGFSSNEYHDLPDHYEFRFDESVIRNRAVDIMKHAEILGNVDSIIVKDKLWEMHGEDGPISEDDFSETFCPAFVGTEFKWFSGSSVSVYALMRDKHTDDYIRSDGYTFES